MLDVPAAPSIQRTRLLDAVAEEAAFGKQSLVVSIACQLLLRELAQRKYSHCESTASSKDVHYDDSDYKGSDKRHRDMHLILR